MTQDYIAVIDSGIGGISLLSDLVKNFPTEKFLYFGDNRNAPYGNKSKRDLLSIALRDVDFVKSFGVKAIVFACNTISVNVMNSVADYTDVPLFGIFPPVERSVINGERTLLFCTERTADNYRSVCGVDVVGLPTLVTEIERNALNISKFHAIDVILQNNSGFFNKEKGYYDTVILGCTHFVFVKNQILNHFCPKKIITGNEFTVARLSKYLNIKKSSVNTKRFQVLFVGSDAELNRTVFEKSG